MDSGHNCVILLLPRYGLGSRYERPLCILHLVESTCMANAHALLQYNMFICFQLFKLNMGTLQLVAWSARLSPLFSKLQSEIVAG